MLFKITPETALTFSKVSTALNCCLPPPINASKTKILIFDILCGLAFISTIFLLIPLLFSVYQGRNDLIIMLKSLYLSCAVAHTSNKVVVCRVHLHRLQVNRFRLVHCEECY